MDIWILVIALLVIAIILLIASYFAGDGQDVEEKINEFSVQQSEELYNIKTRIAELEKTNRTATTNSPSDDSDAQFYNPSQSEEEYPMADEVDDEQHEAIIRLYSQGYTMYEIGQAVKLNSATVQKVIDDYIENR